MCWESTHHHSLPRLVSTVDQMNTKGSSRRDPTTIITLIFLAVSLYVSIVSIRLLKVLWVAYDCLIISCLSCVNVLWFVARRWYFLYQAKITCDMCFISHSTWCHATLGNQQHSLCLYVVRIGRRTRHVDLGVSGTGGIYSFISFMACGESHPITSATISMTWVSGLYWMKRNKGQQPFV